MSCMNCMEFQSEINTGTTDNPLTEIYFRLHILYNIKFQLNIIKWYGFVFHQSYFNLHFLYFCDFLTQGSSPQIIAHRIIYLDYYPLDKFPQAVPVQDNCSPLENYPQTIPTYNYSHDILGLFSTLVEFPSPKIANFT